MKEFKTDKTGLEYKLDGVLASVILVNAIRMKKGIITEETFRAWMEEMSYFPKGDYVTEIKEIKPGVVVVEGKKV